SSRRHPGGSQLRRDGDHRCRRSATDRIGKLVYLDAANPKNGQALVDAGPLIKTARKGARVDDGVELVLFPGTDALGNYGVTDPDDIAWMNDRLTPHP